MGHSTGFSSDDLLPRLITRERNVGQGCSAGKGWQNCSSNARALNKCFRHMVKVKKVKEEISPVGWLLDGYVKTFQRFPSRTRRTNMYTVLLLFSVAGGPAQARIKLNSGGLMPLLNLGGTSQAVKPGKLSFFFFVSFIFFYKKNTVTCSITANPQL